jgi:cytosine/adenosine deaminase-related metal-dependent hydrolase
LRLYTSSWVVPVSGPPIRDGRVAVEAGRIAWLGAARDPGAPEAPLEDLGPGVILPGLVNAHCHLELSYLQGRVALPQPFVAWVRALVAGRARETPNVLRAGAERGIQQLVGGGTVAVGDVSNALAHLDLLAASGLRAAVHLELIGWDPERADAALRAADAGLAALSPDWERAGVSVRLAAHAPHSVSPALFRRLVERGGPAAVHLAEAPTETRFLREGDEEWARFLKERGLGHVAFRPPGMSPVRYLDSLGALRPGLLAAHCVQTDASDHELLARRGVFVAICPRSNRNLEVGAAPVPALLAAGVRLCLGSDGLASVGTLDVLDDVRLLRQTFPELKLETLLRMATLGGAEALGFADLGSLEPGKRAVLVHAKAAAAVADPLEHIVSSETRLERVAVAA